MTDNDDGEGVVAYENGHDFYKESTSLKIWQVEAGDVLGEFLFSFDKKKIFNFFKDYPEKLTDEEIEIFKSEYPELAALKKPRKPR